MGQVKVTFEGASPAAGAVIEEVLVEDPETHDRELFVKDTPHVVDERWSELVEDIEYHRFSVEDVSADLPAKSASRSDWDEAARSVDVDPDLYNRKEDLVEAVEAAA